VSGDHAGFDMKQDLVAILAGQGHQVLDLGTHSTAAVDYPLARQVLDALDIPLPSDDELDQVLPAGDLSIFADLGLDEMELGAVAADLDLYPEDAVAGIAERLRFGEAVERALDLALGS